jgi:hypothetical protein
LVQRILRHGAAMKEKHAKAFEQFLAARREDREREQAEDRKWRSK